MCTENVSEFSLEVPLCQHFVCWTSLDALLGDDDGIFRSLDSFDGRAHLHGVGNCFWLVVGREADDDLAVSFSGSRFESYTFTSCCPCYIAFNRNLCRSCVSLDGDLGRRYSEGVGRRNHDCGLGDYYGIFRSSDGRIAGLDRNRISNLLSLVVGRECNCHRSVPIAGFRRNCDTGALDDPFGIGGYVEGRGGGISLDGNRQRLYGQLVLDRFCIRIGLLPDFDTGHHYFIVGIDYSNAGIAEDGIRVLCCRESDLVSGNRSREPGGCLRNGNRERKFRYDGRCQGTSGIRDRGV